MRNQLSGDLAAQQTILSGRSSKNKKHPQKSLPTGLALRQQTLKQQPANAFGYRTNLRHTFGVSQIGISNARVTRYMR